MKRYNPKEIEPKWSKIWDETGVYTTDLDSSRPKYIGMSMFNYPSGAGIHIGHAMNYTISDVKARFKRQQGFESYHPVGWDAFGLPAENYAIKTGVSPQESMANIIPGYHKQYKAMGWSNDWEKEIATHLPEYYKWSQWIFTQMYKHGLAYQDSRMQWWCPIDNTVLANEQVIDGKCWRHDGPDDPPATKKEIKQWFFKITDYADELLEATDELDWTESVKLAQKNWIGRSKGAEIDFQIDSDLSGQDFVFIHGFHGAHDRDFWQWLKRELEACGAKVHAPDLPNTEEPSVNEQVSFLLKNYHFTAKTNIIAHSLGCAVALKLLPKFKNKIGSVTFAAPCLSAEFRDKKLRPILEQSCDWSFDFAGAKNKAQSFTVLEDLNDSIIPAGKPREVAAALGAIYIETSTNAGHFNDEVELSILEATLPRVKVFTTRADTIFGATFLVLAPEHELVQQITTKEQKKKVDEYVKKTLAKSELERQESKEKTGVFTGAHAINPANNEKIQIWIADYVLTGYGTGAIMAVPAHDDRDHEFSQKFNLPIVEVVDENDKIINSGDYDGLASREAREKIVADLANKGVAQGKVNYRMRDWSVSRQRYWGAPIPIIYCEKCGPQLVPDEDLPVVLPELTDFQPSGDGRSALARAKDWLKVDCPKCGSAAERETDTLDTYVDSSFYMLRYFDPHSQEKIFDSKIANKWAPIDFYNGGDHATAHMLYARFVTRFLNKIGLVDNPEPFKQFVFNGKVTAADGTMFSKSKGNGIDPLEIIAQGYGADALRTYLMFASPLDLWTRWDPQGVPGTYRFLNRLWNLVQEFIEAKPDDEKADDVLRAAHKMIKKVTEDIEENRYNTAIAAMMECLNDLYKLRPVAQNDVWRQALEGLVASVAPFAPFIADELWQQLGHSSSIHKDSWPKWDEKYLTSDEVTIAVQVNGKLRGQIEAPTDADEAAIVKIAEGSDRIRVHLEGKSIVKTIYVPGKILNLVVK